MIDLRQAILLFGGATLLVAFFCWFFLYFVALKSPPSIRASWIAGLSYIAATLIFWSEADDKYGFWTSIAAMPAGAYAFWSFQKDFRRAWIDDPDNLAEGVTLENDDWKVGATRLLLIFVAVFSAAIGGGIGRELVQWLGR